jgi:hypothetical protein
MEATSSNSKFFSSFPNDTYLDPATDSKKTNSVVKFSNILRECMLWELNTCNFTEAASVIGNAIDRNNFVSSIQSGSNPYLSLHLLRQSYKQYKQPIMKMLEEILEKYKQPNPLFKNVEKRNEEITNAINSVDEYLKVLPKKGKSDQNLPDVDLKQLKEASSKVRQFFSLAYEFAVSAGADFTLDDVESQPLRLVTASQVFNITTRSQPL